jgi:hypothetical protein
MSDCKECDGKCKENEEVVEAEEVNEKLVAEKSNKPLVMGYRNEKVIHPLSVLQGRIEAMENMINQNFNAVNQNRFQDFKYFQGTLIQLNSQVEDLQVMVQSLVKLAGIDAYIFAEENKRTKITIEKAKTEADDARNNRKTVDRESTANDLVHFEILDLSSSDFIPGFAEQLVGVKSGDVKDVLVKFPENYGRPDLNGKDAIFTCTVIGVKEKITTENK